MRSLSSHLGIAPTAVLVLLCSLPPLVTLLAIPTASAQTATAQDRKAEADRLLNQGNQQFAHSQFQEALASFQQVLSIYREIGDRFKEGATLNNIGEVFRNLGQYDQALASYQQALEIARVGGYRAAEGRILNNIGLIYDNLGQYDQALASYQQALEIAKAEGDRVVEGRILNNIGLIYDNLGQYDQALNFYRQALEIRKPEGDHVGETLNNIGGIYLGRGQYAQALDSYQQALEVAKSEGDRGVEGRILNNIGLIYNKLGQSDRALNYYQQALEIAKAVGDRNGEAYSLNNLGEAFLQTHELEKATTLLFDSAKVLESIRAGLTDTDKVEFLETQVNPYRTLQLALVSQGRTEEALVASERGRSRAFVEQLAQQLGSQTAEELITQNIPTLDQLKQIAAQHNVTLVEYSFVYDPQLRDSNGQLYTWVVKPIGEIAFQQKDLSTLNTSLADLVDASREAIGVTRGIVGVRPRSGTEQQQAQRLKQLYQLLIQPIADQLPTDPNTPVIFVPQGKLFSVPFAALQDATGQYLIEKHTILTSPSIQLLDKTRQQEVQVKQANLHDVLVVGNPTMPRVSFAAEQPQQLISLAGAEKEANAIAPLLQTQPLLGGQAKKATVMQRMEQARMIHLATHGILDDRQGLESAIALAPDGTGELNDGLLTAAEIAQMKLHAELVVLSACDTAQGRITGDGVIGLSRALIAAGVPSVLVSLWSVPDAPTAELMTEFYQQLQHTDNKAQALRQAMLATKAKHPKPRDWAGFTLIGEAQ